MAEDNNSKTTNGADETFTSLYPSETDYKNVSLASDENSKSSIDIQGFGEEYFDTNKLAAIDKSLGIIDSGSIADQLIFDLPEWGVENYILDRDNWIKGKRSIADEPGWFYFKVFFKFNTNFGLFGGVLDQDKIYQSNCALRYLNTIKTLYRTEQIGMRINALTKFTSILSQINTKYPWIIKGIGGLDKAMSPYIQNFNEERAIELTFNTETTDMKIINMLNYYKLACFDDINCKEILPENLRKFDMMVVFYHVPIKYFQTAIMVSPKRDLTTGIMKPGTKLAKAEEIINKTYNFLTTKSTYYKYKRMHPDAASGYSNMMSFHMFTFNDCEFDANSFNEYFAGAEMKNENAFQFAETKIKINYGRVYYHTMNEWTQTLFGSDGFYYDPTFPIEGNGLPGDRASKIADVKSDAFANRIKSIKEAKAGSTFFDKNAEQYKSIIDFSESVITDGLMNMSMKNYYAFLKGNMFGDVGIGSDYYNSKLNLLSQGNNGAISGNLFGLDDALDKFRNGKESYFKKKIRAIKEGTIKYWSGENTNPDDNSIYDYNPTGDWEYTQLKSDIENERIGLTPTFNVDQTKRQSTDILQYLAGNIGASKLSGNNTGLLGGLKSKINDTLSFWKMSKNDW